MISRKVRRSSGVTTLRRAWYFVCNSAVAPPKFCAALVGHADSMGHGDDQIPVGVPTRLVRVRPVADERASARKPEDMQKNMVLLGSVASDSATSS